MERERGELTNEENAAIVASMVGANSENIDGYVIIAMVPNEERAAVLTCCSVEHALFIMGTAIQGIAQGLGQENGLVD